MYDVELARRINQAHGGAVIAAWQVGELDEMTQYLYRSLDRVGKARGAFAESERIKADIRAEHYAENSRRH